MKFVFENLEKSFGTYITASKILYKGKSKYQNILLFENEKYGKVLRLDKAFQTSEYDEYMYHEPLVQPAMCSHPNPKNVLIIGGGDGGALEEALKHNCVEKITMVELDEDVVKVAKEHLTEINKNSFEDERVRLVFGDGIKFIRECNEKFDVIILDLTDPYSISTYLYTDKFYGEIKSRLNEGGVLSAHAEMPFVLDEIHVRIVKTLRTVFRHVGVFYNFVSVYGTMMGFVNCSDAINPKEISENEIDERLRERGVGDLKIYDGKMHKAYFTIPVIMRKKFDDENVDIITEKSVISAYDELNEINIEEEIKKSFNELK